MRQEAGTEEQHQPSAGDKAGNRTTCRPKTEKGQGHLVRQDYQRQAVLIGEQGYVSVNRNYLSLLDSKENFSRWSQFLRYHLNVKTYDEYKG